VTSNLTVSILFLLFVSDRESRRWRSLGGMRSFLVPGLCLSQECEVISKDFRSIRLLLSHGMILVRQRRPQVRSLLRSQGRWFQASKLPCCPHLQPPCSVLTNTTSSPLFSSHAPSPSSSQSASLTSTSMPGLTVPSSTNRSFFGESAR